MKFHKLFSILVHLTLIKSFRAFYLPKVFNRKSFMALNQIALIVNVEIDSNRLEEFIDVITKDAQGSILNENGDCLRFDVLQDLENPYKFVFYEVYKDVDSIERHKATSHFALWSAFKSSGGVISQTVAKSSPMIYDFKASSNYDNNIWGINEWKSWN